MLFPLFLLPTGLDLLWNLFVVASSQTITCINIFILIIGLCKRHASGCKHFRVLVYCFYKYWVKKIQCNSMIIGPVDISFNQFTEEKEIWMVKAYQCQPGQQPRTGGGIASHPICWEGCVPRHLLSIQIWQCPPCLLARPQEDLLAETKKCIFETCVLIG